MARKLPKEQADEIGMKMLAKVGLQTVPTTTPASFPADSSSGWRLPVPLPRPGNHLL